MKIVTKKQFANSLFWKSCNFIFSKGLSIVISIILARVLGVSDFGLMAIWSVILSFCEVIVMGGMDTVLVQKKDITKKDYSIVLGTGMLRAAALYLVVFFSAPFIAGFYEQAFLTNVLRVVCIDFFSQAVISVIVAKRIRNMDFKTIFFADFLATLCGGMGAVLVFYTGLGQWALVCNTLTHKLMYALFLMAFDRFSVGMSLGGKRYKELFVDGKKVVANNLIDLCTSGATTLVIGKKWNATEVGYLDNAEKYTQLAGVESYNVISDLLLPTFSSCQDDVRKMKEIGRRLIALSCYLMFPLMLGLAMCSEEVVQFLLTEKWLPAAPLMQIACAKYAVNPIRQACAKINYAAGKYRSNLVIELIRLVLTGISLVTVSLLVAPDITVICWSMVTVLVITVACYVVSLRKSVGYVFGELAVDIIPTVLLSGASMVPVILLKLLHLPLIVYLVVAVASAVITYVGLSALFKVDMFCYVVSSIKGVIGKRKREL